MNIKPQNPKTELAVTEPSFRKPGTETWEPLKMSSVVSNGEDNNTTKDCQKAGQANEELKTILLQSLQMQHLVVLAGSGCSYDAGGPTMGKLWNSIVENNQTQAQSVARIVKYNIDTSKNIEAFLSQIEGANFLQEPKINSFLNNAKEIILRETTSFLLEDSKEKLKAHETFLHRLSRRRIRDQRLRVFTTNYDLCFERTAASIGCVAIDGFSFVAPRIYDPRYFDYDIIRRPRFGDEIGNYLEGVFLLYKLHGSVIWEKTDYGVIETANPDPQKACLIYPASGKYQESYSQPFIESISQYLSAIREPNTCLLVVGFGFNDDHLSEPLLSAVRSNPHLRLIVVDPNAKEKATKDSNRYFSKLLELSINGEDIFFINDTFENFANRIPDLKTLTPAERLFKDIKGVMQRQ